MEEKKVMENAKNEINEKLDIVATESYDDSDCSGAGIGGKLILGAGIAIGVVGAIKIHKWMKNRKKEKEQRMESKECSNDEDLEDDFVEVIDEDSSEKK